MSLETSAVRLVAHGSPVAWVVVFAAGVVSSLGPCASPRLVALCALVVRSRSPLAVGCTFVGSLVSAYAALGLAGTAVADLVRSASWIYGLIAIAALVGGVVSLAGVWVDHADHAHTLEVPHSNDLSAAFLSGIGFALMVSPCCTPIVGAIIAYTTSRGDGAMGAGMLAAFGLGHAAPLVPIIAGGRSTVRWIRSCAWTDAVGVAAASCMIALGGYYALLV